MKEFNGIVENFIKNEIDSHIRLNEEMKQLIKIVCLCVVDGEDEIKDLIKEITSENSSKVKEAILQCTPYIGSPKVRKIMKICNYEDEYTMKSLDARFISGKNKRSEIFGVESANKNLENSRDDLKHIQCYLCSYCFGDFYTRDGLSIKERELLTFCILSSLGGCESQVKSHIKGNINVGNTRENLIDAITVCLPYIGFPRTLNAITCINEITLK